MHFFLQLIWSSLCFTDLNLVFAYSLFLSPFVPPDSIHMIEKTHESPSHNFHFAYQNAKLLLCVDFLMRRKISLFTCRECTLGTFLHAGCCHQYFGKWVFQKKKNGIDKRLLAQGTKIATFIQKNKNEQTTSGVFIPQHLALVCPFLRFCMPCKTESWSIFYFFNKNELEINLDKVSWQVEESIILHDDYSVFAFC